MAKYDNSNPPKINQDVTFPIILEDYANPGNPKTNPTIAAGDFKIYIGNANPVNLTDLPAVDPAGYDQVMVYVRAAQNTANSFTVAWKDQTSPPEWTAGSIGFLTTA